MIDHIRRGGKDGGDDKVDKDSILSVTIEKRNGYKPHFCQKDHEDRHLKDNTKGNEQPQGQRKILADRWQRGKKFVGIADQKTKGRRKNDKVAKGCPTKETEGRKYGKRYQYAFLLLIEAGGNKEPDLVKNNRTGEEQTADQGEL